MIFWFPEPKSADKILHQFGYIQHEQTMVTGRGDIIEAGSWTPDRKLKVKVKYIEPKNLKIIDNIHTQPQEIKKSKSYLDLLNDANEDFILDTKEPKIVVEPEVKKTFLDTINEIYTAPEKKPTDFSANLREALNTEVKIEKKGKSFTDLLADVYIPPVIVEEVEIITVEEVKEPKAKTFSEQLADAYVAPEDVVEEVKEKTYKKPISMFDAAFHDLYKNK